MSRYYLGTAGWSYKDWEGIVYPRVKGRDFQALTFIAAFIDVVEVNSTFYRMPSLHVSLSWVRKVEGFPDFLFTIKLHQSFTHGQRSYTQKDVDDFKFGLEPLRARGRLAAILIQFPWSFACTTSHLDFLARLFANFSDYPLALEVRHGSWERPDFHKFLEAHKVGFCNIDQPQFPNSIQPSALTTTPDFSYVRLHGRNHQNWFKKDAGRDARYDYLYSADELKEWKARIRQLGSQSDKVFVVTNNHYRGQALANAFQLKNMISGEKLDIPLELLAQYPILKSMLEKKMAGQMDLFGEDDPSD